MLEIFSRDYRLQITIYNGNIPNKIRYNNFTVTGCLDRSVDLTYTWKKKNLKNGWLCGPSAELPVIFRLERPKNLRVRKSSSCWRDTFFKILNQRNSLSTKKLFPTSKMTRWKFWGSTEKLFFWNFSSTISP